MLGYQPAADTDQQAAGPSHFLLQKLENHKHARADICNRQHSQALPPWSFLSAGGSDHRPVTILIDQKTPVSTFKRAPSWNYKRADWNSFRQLAEEECMGLQLSEENMDHNAVQFNNAILRAAKKSIPRGRRRNYNPFWTPQLEQLQEDVNRAREDMGRNPSDQAQQSTAKPELNLQKRNPHRHGNSGT